MKKAMVVIKEQEILGKDFKVYGTADEPLFLAKDVAEWIGYSKSGNGSYSLSMMVKTIDPDEKLKATIFTSGQNREVLFLTERGVKQVVANSRKYKAIEHITDMDDILKSKNTPKQTNFELMLKQSLKTHLESGINFNVCPWNSKEECYLLYKDTLNFKTEVLFDNYRVDIYFKHFGLIVEYDEKHHDRQVKEDKIRELNLHRIYNNKNDNVGWEYNGSLLTIIRVSEGREFEGIIRIISHLMAVFI